MVENTRRFIVIAVPGTQLGQKNGEPDFSDWFDTCRDLEDTLNTQLVANSAASGSVEVDIRCFAWTRKNNQIDREKAAEDLAEIIASWGDKAKLAAALKAHCKARPGQVISAASDSKTDFILLGHSHAGNVIVDAIKNLGERGKLDQIPRFKGCLTVGAPFFRLNPGWFQRKLGPRSFRLPFLRFDPSTFAPRNIEALFFTGLLVVVTGIRQFRWDGLTGFLQWPESKSVAEAGRTVFPPLDAWVSGFVNNALFWFAAFILVFFFGVWGMSRDIYLRARNRRRDQIYADYPDHLIVYDNRDEAVDLLSRANAAKRTRARELAAATSEHARLFIVFSALTTANEQLERSKTFFKRMARDPHWIGVGLFIVFLAGVIAEIFDYPGLARLSNVAYQRARAFVDTDYYVAFGFVLIGVFILLLVQVLQLRVDDRFKGRLEKLFGNLVDANIFGSSHDRVEGVSGGDDARRIPHPKLVQRALDAVVTRQQWESREKASSAGAAAADEFERIFNKAADLFKGARKPARKALEEFRNLFNAYLEGRSATHNAYFQSATYKLFLAKQIAAMLGAKVRLTDKFDAALKRSLAEDGVLLPVRRSDVPDGGEDLGMFIRSRGVLTLDDLEDNQELLDDFKIWRTWSGGADPAATGARHSRAERRSV